MHRVKGLEFNRRILASVNDGLVPLKPKLDGKRDAVEHEIAGTEERAPVYVIATRAKIDLVVTSYGKTSALIASRGTSG